MKKLIILLICLFNTVIVVSQKETFCIEEFSLVMSGDYYDYELELPDCTKNVTITTLDGDTVISGITFIDPYESLRIIPTEGYTINIKPKELSDIIDAIISVGDRGIEGTEELDDKDLSMLEISIYPSPVMTTLNIEINRPVFGYQIKDLYDVVRLEGEELTNNTINVSSLDEGLYYLILQTETHIIIKSFIKN